jgi:hypothetical protein
MIGLAALLYFYMTYENRRRDKEMGLTGNETQTDMLRQAVDDGFKDLTDKGNRSFRYAL